MVDDFFISENNIKKTLDSIVFIKSSISEDLFKKTMEYIELQTKNNILIGNINNHEYGSVLLNSEMGLYRLIFFENWENEDNIKTFLEKDNQKVIFWRLTTNILRMIFTRIRQGNDLELEKIKKQFKNFLITNNVKKE